MGHRNDAHALHQKRVAYSPSACYKTSDNIYLCPRFNNIQMPASRSQKEKLLAYMAMHPLARSRDLAKIGIAATTLSRAVTEGELMRVGRGLYQLPDAEADTNMTLAEVAKRVPNGIICMMSALAFHGLTDQLPRKVWIAIGAKDWAPKLDYPPIRPVRFREPYFSEGVKTYGIGGTLVRIYSIPKSIADAFRNPKLVDRSVAVECLKSALTDRKASPAELAQAADTYGVAKRMRPYLEALTANG